MIKRIIWFVGALLSTTNIFAQDIPFQRNPVATDFPVPQGGYLDTGDIDGDGDLDVITSTNYGGAIYRYIWDAPNSKYLFTQFGANYDNAVIGNFNKTGALDVIAGSRSTGVQIFLDNSTTGPISIADPNVAEASWSSLFGVAAVDFDNDGDDDIVAGKYEAGGDLFFFRNDDMTFVLTDTVITPFGWTGARLMQIKVADFDGDGFQDIVVANENWPNDKAFKVFKNNGGNGTFTDAYTALVDDVNDGRYGSFDVKDINGDGKMDIHMRIYLQATKTFQIGIWMNDGNMAFSRSYKTAPTKGLGNFSFADFNLDGKLDLAYNEGGNVDTAAAVVLGDGTGNFSTVAYTYVTSGAYPGLTSSYDVNGDGNPDLVDKDAIHFNNIVVAPKRGLVAAYSFDGDYKDTVGDSDGTATGTMFVPDRFGNENSAVYFDGVDDFVDLGDVNIPIIKNQMTDSLSVTMWVKIDNDSQAGGIFTRRNNENQAYMTLYYQAPSPAAPVNANFPAGQNHELVWMADGPNYFSTFRAIANPTPSQWHYVVVSKLGTKTIMYMDGVKIDEADDSYDYTSNGSFTGFGNAIIGMAPAWNTDSDKVALKGSIDDIKVYYGALTDAQVTSNFNEASKDLWVMNIKAEQNNYYANAQLGMSANATDVLDQQIDTPEPPEASSNNVRAWFSHPEWNGALTDNYSADIRAFHALSTSSEIWNLSVKTTIAGNGTLTLSIPDVIDVPVVVKYNGSSWVATTQTLSIPFTSDGSTTMVYQIVVGDTTPPELTVGAMFEGPKVWDNTVDRLLTWTATDDNFSGVLVEFSSDGGSSYSTIYQGTESSFTYNLPDLAAAHNCYFRVTASDIIGNTAQFTTSNPISIVAPTFQSAYSAGWTLVGNSFAGIDSAKSSFAQDVFEFEWDGFGYTEYQGYVGADAFWLGAYASGSQTLAGPVAEDDMQVKMFSGWNMIASPILRSVDVDSLKVVNNANSTTLSYADALAAELVTSPFRYTTENSFVTTGSFVPFEGYWIGISAENIDLVFPIHNPVAVGKTVEESDDENVAIISYRDGAVESYFGFGTSITNNVPLPPPAPQTNLVGILGELTVLGDSYMELGVDLENGAEYTLSKSGEAREVQLSWIDQSFTDGFEYILVTSEGEELDLSVAGNYIWNTGSESIPKVVARYTTTSNEEDNSGLPSEVTLSQNYPNPFNPTTSITFALPSSDEVRLSLYNMLGQKVATIVNGVKSAGTHTINFDASNLSSGIYIYMLETSNQMITKQMILLK